MRLFKEGFGLIFSGSVTGVAFGWPLLVALTATGPSQVELVEPSEPITSAFSMTVEPDTKLAEVTQAGEDDSHGDATETTSGSGTGDEGKGKGIAHALPRKTTGKPLRAPTSGGTRKVAAAKTTAPRSGKCKREVDGLDKLSSVEYRVERSLVDSYANDWGKLNSLGWVEKAKDGKETLGFEVNGFGCRGVLHKGGLRRGDVVLSVNNKPVKSIFHAVRAYKTLRKEELIRVKVLRNGQPVELTYHIVS